MGIITLVSLIVLETVFLVWSIRTRNNHREEKGIISMVLLVLFVLLLITGGLEWSFRYIMILLVLVIQAIMGAVILLRKREKDYRLRKNILRFIRNCFIFTFALYFAILFPQYEQPQTTGNYEVGTAKYTWVDNSRTNEFSQTGENRSLTVECPFPNKLDT